MVTLFYSPGACSMAVHVLLNEIGTPFTLENAAISEGKNRSPEYLALNPRGQVPLLVDGDLVIREGAAILIHLLEKHQSPLLPTSAKDRAAAIEWLMFCNATLHPAYSRGFFLMRNPADQAAKDALMTVVVANINKLWEEVEARLENSSYLAGDSITIADILLTVIANWSGRFTGIEIGARTKALLSKMIARPSYKKALETEQVDYKAAA